MLRPIDQSLFAAAESGDLERARDLLDRGADLNARDDTKATPLHIAARYGHFDVVELFIANGADVNARDMYLTTPLHEAAFKGYALSPGSSSTTEPK